MRDTWRQGGLLDVCPPPTVDVNATVDGSGRYSIFLGDQEGENHSSVWNYDTYCMSATVF